MSFYIIFNILLLVSEIYTTPSCINKENFCNKCNPLTNLCIKCKLDILIPDKNGGCIGAKKCILGKNYCSQCNMQGELCQICENGYYPDKNGGCSYTENCKISNKGNCLECDNDYILIGMTSQLKICKYKNSDDLKNCKEINIENGLCENCEEGYFLNTGDKKCSKTENCSESIYGNCISCYIGYYLNKKNNTCLLKVGNFLYCKQSLNDENCEICDEMSYLDENGICSLSNYCSKSSNGICQKCISNYYLSTFNNICSNEKNCNEADRDTGLCTICKSDYFLDTNDYKCKSNIENNEFKYCLKVVNNLCTECIKSYILSKDSKCVDTYNCLESENGKCILCEKNYHLGLDNKCTDIEHCIYTNEHGFCIECEDNYYYNTLGKNCTYDIDKFKNCKTSAGFYCSECKNNYYLNLNDSTCQDNTQKGPFYKCALSDKEEEFCIRCIEGYYLGTEDKKCSLIENCKISKDENTCIECDESLCLDLKKNICVENDYIEDENKKFYFACKRTNIEGTKCELCIEGYEVGKDGYCVDNSRCLEEKDGKCLKCTEEENENGYSYCANEIFGCVESIWEGCLRCDDLLDIFSCTKCKEGYVDALSGGCNPIE